MGLNTWKVQIARLYFKKSWPGVRGAVTQSSLPEKTYYHFPARVGMAHYRDLITELPSVFTTDMDICI